MKFVQKITAVKKDWSHGWLILKVKSVNEGEWGFTSFNSSTNQISNR